MVTKEERERIKKRKKCLSVHVAMRKIYLGTKNKFLKTDSEKKEEEQEICKRHLLILFPSV